MMMMTTTTMMVTMTTVKTYKMSYKKWLGDLMGLIWLPARNRNEVEPQVAPLFRGLSLQLPVEGLSSRAETRPAGALWVPEGPTG